MFSQDVRVEAILDTHKLRIGEQVRLDLYVTYNSKLRDLKIQWPSIGDTLTGKIEVISVSQIDTTLPEKSNSNKVYQHQQLVLSVYDSGYYAVPSLRFVLDNDSAKSLFTNPLFLEVHTVPTDTSLAKTKDIKPPFDEPFNWKWYISYLYWGIAVAILIAIAVIVTLYLSRRKKVQMLEPEKPKIPPHITALEALEKIKAEQSWKEGKVKEYYSLISETVRTYIEGRYNLMALESTTDEIMKAFRSQVIDPDSKDKLHQILVLSDLVKFAKQTPVESEHQFTLQNAFDFVNGTKREDPMVIEEETTNQDITQEGTT